MFKQSQVWLPHYSFIQWPVELTKLKLRCIRIICTSILVETTPEVHTLKALWTHLSYLT